MMKGLSHFKKFEINKSIDFIYAFLFAVCFAFIIYKCRFGFGNIDEAFYLTIPYRLCRGDGLFADEFHLSQMSSVFIYPLMKVYLSVFDNTDGIILAFRYVFSVLHAATSVFLYVRLKNRTYAALFISLLYLIFTPFGIMALSYNSIGLAFLSISAVLIYTSDYKPCAFCFAGLFLAGAVLCCPFLVILYFYYFILTVINYLRAKEKRLLKAPVIKSFIFLTLGCFTLAVIFFAFVLSRASVSEIIDAFPLILSDPEHPSKSVARIICDYAVEFLALRRNKYAVMILGAGAALLLSSKFWKKSQRSMRLFLLVGALLTFAYTVSIFFTSPYLNYLMFPFVIIGAFSFALFPKENIRELLCLYLPGLIYGFCMSCSSNQGFYVISTAAFVSLMGSVIMLLNAAKVLLRTTEKKINIAYKGCIALFLAFCFLCTFKLRYSFVFWESGGMPSLTEKISVGANKGIYTTKERMNDYTAEYNSLAEVRNFEGEGVLYFSDKTYFYLEDTKKNASFSAWLSGVNKFSSDRLVEYYKSDKSRLPQIVYCHIDDYNPKYSLFKYLEENGYECHKSEASCVFRRN